MSADTLIETEAVEVKEPVQEDTSVQEELSSQYLRIGAAELQETITYLSTRPWNEVHKLMGAVIESIKALNN